MVSLLLQSICVFKMPLSGFIFGNGRLILCLFPQKYSSFQSAFLLGFIFDNGHLILSLSAPKYLSFQNASLWIYV